MYINFIIFFLIFTIGYGLWETIWTFFVFWSGDLMCIFFYHRSFHNNYSPTVRDISIQTFITKNFFLPYFVALQFFKLCGGNILFLLSWNIELQLLWKKIYCEITFIHGVPIFVVFVRRVIHEIKNPANNETWEAARHRYIGRCCPRVTSTFSTSCIGYNWQF